MNIGSLCTGYGGLDHGLMSAVGGTVVWNADIDPGACRILAHRYPHTPNLGDIKTADWATAETVDWLTAGYPCQPFSAAGKRKGSDDERHLWPAVADAIRLLRPGHVLLENVRGHLSLGFGTVLSDLAALGYVGSWFLLRASDVGAPHGRARIFIVAENTDRPVGDQWRLAAPGQTESGRPWSDAGGRSGAPVADAGGERHGGRQDARLVGRLDRADEGTVGERQRSRQVAGDRSATAAPDTDSTGLEGRNILRGGASQRVIGPDGLEPEWGTYGPAVRRWEHTTGRRAPRPTEAGRNGDQRLSPRFVEWMMGLTAGWVTDVPGLTRNAQLKALGNGVVPQQAKAAVRILLDTQTEAAA